MDKVLGLLGLAHRAGTVEIGEEPTAAATRAKAARLLVLASDAADNSFRRARHFSESGACPLLRLPCTKDELGSALGRTSCAMAAVTDIGFAKTIAERLAEQDEAKYGETAERLRVKAARFAERKREKIQHEKNVRSGKYKAAKKKEESIAASPQSEDKKETVKRSASRPHRSASERMKAKRNAQKQDARSRYAAARPVKKGKGSHKTVKRTDNTGRF